MPLHSSLGERARLTKKKRKRKKSRKFKWNVKGCYNVQGKEDYRQFSIVESMKFRWRQQWERRVKGRQEPNFNGLIVLVHFHTAIKNYL